MNAAGDLVGKLSVLVANHGEAVATYAPERTDLVEAIALQIDDGIVHLDAGQMTKVADCLERIVTIVDENAALFGPGHARTEHTKELLALIDQARALCARAHTA